MRDLKEDLQWLDEHAPNAHASREHLKRALRAEGKLSEIQSVLNKATSATERLDRIGGLILR